MALKDAQNNITVNVDLHYSSACRVWEKMAAAMQSKAKEAYAASKAKKAIGTAAKKVGGLWWHEHTPRTAHCSGGAVRSFQNSRV